MKYLILLLLTMMTNTSGDMNRLTVEPLPRMIMERTQFPMFGTRSRTKSQSRTPTKTFTTTRKSYKYRK